MDQIALVGHQIDDGQRLLEELVRAGFPLAAACWMKTEEDAQFYLYLASPLVDDKGLTEGYGRVHPVVRAMPQPFWVDPFEVKLLAVSDPMARDLLDLQRRSGGHRYLRNPVARLGDANIDGLIVYPTVSRAAPVSDS
jgi:hypothetical protein